MSKAMGLIETAGLAISIEVTNEMLKIADVSCIYQEIEDIELVTILIKGDTDSVKLAIEKGVEVASKVDLLFAFSIIPIADSDVESLVRQGVINGETYLRSFSQDDS